MPYNRRFDGGLSVPSVSRTPDFSPLTRALQGAAARFEVDAGNKAADAAIAEGMRTGKWALPKAAGAMGFFSQTRDNAAQARFTDARNKIVGARQDNLYSAATYAMDANMSPEAREQVIADYDGESLKLIEGAYGDDPAQKELAMQSRQSQILALQNRNKSFVMNELAHEEKFLNIRHLEYAGKRMNELANNGDTDALLQTRKYWEGVKPKDESELVERETMLTAIREKLPEAIERQIEMGVETGIPLGELIGGGAAVMHGELGVEASAARTAAAETAVKAYKANKLNRVGLQPSNMGTQDYYAAEVREALRNFDDETAGMPLADKNRLRAELQAEVVSRAKEMKAMPSLETINWAPLANNLDDVIAKVPLTRPTTAAEMTELERGMDWEMRYFAQQLERATGAPRQETLRLLNPVLKIKLSELRRRANRSGGKDGTPDEVKSTMKLFNEAVVARNGRNGRDLVANGNPQGAVVLSGQMLTGEFDENGERVPGTEGAVDEVATISALSLATSDMTGQPEQYRDALFQWIDDNPRLTDNRKIALKAGIDNKARELLPGIQAETDKHKEMLATNGEALAEMKVGWRVGEDGSLEWDLSKWAKLGPELDEKTRMQRATDFLAMVKMGYAVGRGGADIVPFGELQENPVFRQAAAWAGGNTAKEWGVNYGQASVAVIAYQRITNNREPDPKQVDALQDPTTRRAAEAAIVANGNSLLEFGANGRVRRDLTPALMLSANLAGLPERGAGPTATDRETEPAHEERVAAEILDRLPPRGSVLDENGIPLPPEGILEGRLVLWEDGSLLGDLAEQVRTMDGIARHFEEGRLDFGIVRLRGRVYAVPHNDGDPMTSGGKRVMINIDGQMQRLYKTQRPDYQDRLRLRSRELGVPYPQIR